MTNVKEIKICEVCGSNELISVLDLGNHPLCDDLIPVGENSLCSEYPIEIMHCNTCVTSHQRFQVPKKVLFPKTYHYRARFTADVLSGMRNLVSNCEDVIGDLKGLKVLDIGCNDGSLLNFFKEKGCQTIGVEPTGAYTDALENGHDVYNTYFGNEISMQIHDKHGFPDLITFTNVFAHIENLEELLVALKKLIGENTFVVIENHYLGSILNRKQFDTFYHEHPRSYSLTSFIYIAKALGMFIKQVEFPSRYGGNIRVVLSKKEIHAQDEKYNEIIAEEKGFGNLYSVLRQDMKDWKSVKGEEIKILKENNIFLYAKGFPGRAAILIKLLGLDENIIKGVFEKPGSNKIGHYVPGTKIPILSDDELFSMEKPPKQILNLAWHISDEIKKYLKSNDYDGEVVDIL